jgi:hypothetical protein
MSRSGTGPRLCLAISTRWARTSMASRRPCYAVIADSTARWPLRQHTSSQTSRRTLSIRGEKCPHLVACGTFDLGGVAGSRGLTKHTDGHGFLSDVISSRWLDNRNPFLVC